MTRESLGYVVAVDGSLVRINLHDSHKGNVILVPEGASVVGGPDSVLGIDDGLDVVVIRVQSLEITDPTEAHRMGVGTATVSRQPLRTINAYVVGLIRRVGNSLTFDSHDWRGPALGASAVPLNDDELQTVMNGAVANEETIELGESVTNPALHLSVRLNSLLAQHLAVLGSSGQGKTFFIASLVQQLIAKYRNPRIVIFDVNGEYESAFNYLGDRAKFSRVGHSSEANPRSQHLSIPYYALGRAGLTRLLSPSDKTQAPALRFALGRLPYVVCNGEGAGFPTDASFPLRDDGLQTEASEAWNVMNRLRDKSSGLTAAKTCPHLRAVACLVADGWALVQKPRGPERDGFLYGNVVPLINRIHGLLADSMFTAVIDVDGGGKMSTMESGSQELVREVFGLGDDKDVAWAVHVVDLSQLSKDLMPGVLGALLDTYADELFRLGPEVAYPTALVLEEAHHYLVAQGFSDRMDSTQPIPYERLAKEGRKFNLQ